MAKKRRDCARCRKLERKIREQEEQLLELRRKSREQQKQLRELQALVRELESKLNTNSSNSSIPPSKDPLNAPGRESKARSKKARGAQPGHGKTSRPLLPVEEVDEVIDVRPTTCDCCGLELDGDDPNPHRHQVSELPEIKPLVWEWRLHTLGCSCGVETTAKLPAGVPQSAFGPRLSAGIALFSGRFHLSKRLVQELLDCFFGVTISLGSVCACERRVSQALAGPLDEAKRYIEEQPTASVDETGWRQAKGKAWLWTATTSLVSVFLIHAKRGSQAFKELVGNFCGILSSDRWSVYNSWEKDNRQLCWAHLIRDFKKFLDLSEDSADVGCVLLFNVDKMFEWWHRVRDGTLARSTFQRYMGPIKQNIRTLLEQGCACPDRKTRATCSDLLDLWPALWTFVRFEGVEPTNNAAERVLRPAVLWRKGSFGTDSPEGSRFVERILTVTATLRKQGRNLLEFVTAACQARLDGSAAPSLLPEKSATIQSRAMRA